MNHLIKGVMPAFVFVLIGAGCLSPSNAENSNLQTTNTNDAYEANVQPMIEDTTIAPPTILPAERITNKQVRIKTAKGDIVIGLYPDTAPLTVSNFIGLIERDYYDGIIFHRRQEGFVIQGGDPTGTGAGGPGYTFEDELNDDYPYTRGRVAMANRGPDTNGSQFFIMLADHPLPKQYSVFGEVLEGLDVVDRIEIGDAMLDVVIEDRVGATGAVEEGAVSGGEGAVTE